MAEFWNPAGRTCSPMPQASQSTRNAVLPLHGLMPL